MKYTKEQLQAMSDFEVNKALALLIDDIIDPPIGCATEIFGDKICYIDKHDLGYVECHKGYCDEVGEVMPLAFEHKLSLMPVIIDDWEWQALKNNMVGVSHYYTDKNPLRAIACCLILVLQERKA